MPSFLKFFVYEDNVEFPVSDMTEPQCAAIEECVKDIIPSQYTSSGFLFDVETSIADDLVEEEGCGLLKCNSLMNGVERAVPMPYELLKFLAGKKFRVKPNQYGMNPWGKKVQILFEALPPRVVPIVRSAASVPTVSSVPSVPTVSSVAAVPTVSSVASVPTSGTQVITITIPASPVSTSVSVSVSVSVSASV